MSTISFEGVNLYDWVPFFAELSGKICDIGKDKNRNDILKQKAGECFGFDSAIYRYKEVDPLSFIYFLAQKNTIKQKIDIYKKIQETFNLVSQLPTDWIYPTPMPSALALFHDGQNFKTDLLWNIFICACTSGKISEDDFSEALKIKYVKSTKLTHTLFLINPKEFLPVDIRMAGLPIFSIEAKEINPSIDNIGLSFYIKILDAVRRNFPGCELYEINLFSYLLSSKNLFINNRFFQISSNVYNDGDEIDSFFQSNSVYTGGPSSSEDGYTYPVVDPQRGDIIIIRTGNLKVRAITIVLDNDYSIEGKWTDEAVVKVLRIAVDDRNINSNQFTRKEALNAITEAKEKEIRKIYPETFNIIDQITGKLKKMANISQDNIKNLILQGAPGTGKTRFAKQIALYLQTENSSLSELLENDSSMKDGNGVFTRDPIIEKENEQIKIVQFHPSYTYEDFVRGIITEPDVDGRVNYNVRDKVLMKMVKSATENPDKKYVLIIDEMNRANIPSVLGELIYALEYRGEQVDGVYKDEATGSYEIIIPENLYIIGTMNTADRSIGHIDYAIRRRFVFKDIKPDINVIQDNKAKELYKTIEILFANPHLSPDFKKDDVMLGHSYFLTEKRTIKQRLDFEIKPLLREYIKDGILIGEEVAKKIEELN